nr:MerR family transcriptional regulator [Streptomyces sp. NBC_00899]
MEDELLSIGEMARDSGLNVSALRFYDGAGVLVPVWVDPASGYRWYGPEQVDEARLLARLRRAGMPLADIRLVLAGWSSADADLVRTLLQAHLRRLEVRLGDARGEFSTVRALLERRENPMTTTRTHAARTAVAASELAAALDAVRFAASTDTELPMLGGVLFDIEGDTIHAVATDRYRMAVAQAGTSGHGGPRAQVIVPSPLADAMRALLTGDGSARISVDGGRVALEAGDREVAGQCLDHDYPDYRRLVQLPAGTRALVDVADFRAAVESGPTRPGETREQGGVPCELSVLKVTGDGTVAVCDDGDDDHGAIAVNREFLLDALAAGGGDRLILEFGTPTAPMAIRRPDTEHTFSILMPVRLES